MQRARSARVRTAALGTTVGLCLLIPLAAAAADGVQTKAPAADGGKGAVPSAQPRPSGGSDFGDGTNPNAPDGVDAVKELLAAANAARPGTASAPASSGRPAASGTPGAPAPAGTPAPPAPSGAATPSGAASAPVANAVCGKAAEAPGGIRAQTCVEREGAEVWARVYYRNPTAEPLLLVLSLLRPDHGTVEIRCEIAAKAGEGQCETPRLRTDQPLSAWSAIAEIATADGSRKVLRSGTASATG